MTKIEKQLAQYGSFDHILGELNAEENGL